jgi:hypothetical protein
VWLVDDSWYARASKVIELFIQKSNDKAVSSEDWICVECSEQNGAAFDVCWQCGAEK